MEFELLEQTLPELIKASPFAVICILFTVILNGSHKRQIKELSSTYQQTITEIKEVYEKVYKRLDTRKK